MKVLYFVLKILAKLVIRKYKPKIIGITGSVGKTSTKEAVFSVLYNKFNVNKGINNYNNEIGLPLLIFNKKSGDKSIFKWLLIFVYVIKILIFKDKNYPKILILEMASDKIGDIKYLTSIAKPDIALITVIGSSHLENFGSLKNIIKEKGSILDKLNKNNYAILNQDDKEVINFKEKIKSKVITFGRSKESDVYISSINIIFKNGIIGTSFKLNYSGSKIPIFLPNILGWQYAQAAAAATAVGLSLGMNLVEIGKNLIYYKPIKGRINLIKGIKNTYIIDDTYNSSPKSSIAALEVLNNFPVNGRKIAVFGDMLELGKLTEKGHLQVGKKVVEFDIDYLFTLGDKSKDISKGAKEFGMLENNIFSFLSIKDIVLSLKDKLKKDDIILIKGSRGIKMEKIVYEIMKEKLEANKLLVSKINK